MVKKWQTTIESHVDVKMVGYLLCVFCVAFTKKCKSKSEDHLCSVLTGLPNPEDDYGNQTNTNKCLERSGQ